METGYLSGKPAKLLDWGTGVNYPAMDSTLFKEEFKNY